MKTYLIALIMMLICLRTNGQSNLSCYVHQNDAHYSLEGVISHGMSCIHTVLVLSMGTYTEDIDSFYYTDTYSKYRFSISKNKKVLGKEFAFLSGTSIDFYTWGEGLAQRSFYISPMKMNRQKLPQLGSRFILGISNPKEKTMFPVADSNFIVFENGSYQYFLSGQLLSRGTYSIRKEGRSLELNDALRNCISSFFYTEKQEFVSDNFFPFMRAYNEKFYLN